MAVTWLNLIGDNFLLILDIALTIIIPLAILKVLGKFIYKIFEKFDIEPSSIVTLMEIIRDIVIIFIVIGILNVFGVDIKALFVSLGLLTVAVSLAAKDTLANFVSGIMVMVERRFKIGDVIEIDGHKGHVKTISFKSVILVSNKKEIVIPNSVFSTKPLINYTKENHYMLDIPLNLINKNNLEESMQKIDELLKNNDLILKNPPHRIYVREFTTSGVNLIVRVWIEDAYQDDYTISEINKEIKSNIPIEDIY